VPGLQTAQLFDDEEQEEHAGQDRTEEVLQPLQDAYRAQGNQVLVYDAGQ
jgi:hypothetical protein